MNDLERKVTPEEVFCCPACKESLSWSEAKSCCGACGRRFEVRNGIPDFHLAGPERPQDMNLVYLDPGVAEAKDTVFRLTARDLKGMAYCMEEIGRQASAGSRVLEVGIGTGHFTRWIAEVAGPEAEIYACDFSWPMLEKAAVNTGALPNVVLFRANVRIAMPFRMETFDVILVRLAPFKPADLPNACFDLLRPGGRYFEASTTRGERFDVPPTQWATDRGFESAEYRIWRYPRYIPEEAVLAGLMDGPRQVHEVADLEKARAVTAAMKRLCGTERGIEQMQVESLLLAQKPGAVSGV